MKRILFIIAVFALCLLFSNCASSSYAFMIDSNPEHADIKVINDDGKVVYADKTPATVPSKYVPKKGFIITLSKEGYEDHKIDLLHSKIKKLNLGKRELKKIE